MTAPTITDDADARMLELHGVLTSLERQRNELVAEREQLVRRRAEQEQALVDLRGDAAFNPERREELPAAREALTLLDHEIADNEGMSAVLLQRISEVERQQRELEEERHSAEVAAITSRFLEQRDKVQA